MKTISVTDEVYEKIKDLIPNNKELDSFIGNNFYIRTVTYHCTCKIVGIIAGRFFKLENASWIPDTPRFYNFINDGALDEVEPYGDSFLAIDVIVEIIPWKHPLPNKQL